jgi:hypothetical protein
VSSINDVLTYAETGAQITMKVSESNEPTIIMLNIRSVVSPRFLLAMPCIVS